MPCSPVRIARWTGLSRKSWFQRRPSSIAGGTDEIQKNIIAERVLKMPKEPRTDTDRPFRDVPKNIVT